MSRVAAASREDVLRAAARRFARGERIDVQAVVAETGVARATVHRWFGTRERLAGEALVLAAAPVIEQARERAAGGGATGIVDALDEAARTLAANEGLRRFLEHEREVALRILTNSGGAVQPAWVAALQDLIEEEVAAGRCAPPLEPAALAYAAIRLTEAFLYNDAIAGLRGDVDRLGAVLAALFGLGPAA